MTLLKTDDKALIPPPPVIPSPPVPPAPAESGEPGPEQIWREPAGRLLARLKTKIEGLTTCGVQVPARELWRKQRVGRENRPALAPVPRPF